MRFVPAINKSIVILLCCLFIVTAFSPNNRAQPLTQPYQDGADGIWEDTLFNNTQIYYAYNLSLANGAVELKGDQSENKTYDFNDITVQRNHFAYKYRTLFFIPWWNTFAPTNHISKENIFDMFRNESIKKIDNDYATWNASFLHSFVVQHFRFQLDSSAEFINNITINWFGKASKNANLDFYFWNLSGGVLKKGKWEDMGEIHGDGENKISYTNFTPITKGDIKNALDENNYIDICIVGYFFPILFKHCSLSTDYINLTTQGEKGYHIGKGSITTKFPINASNISSNYIHPYWEQFTWDDYQGSGTSIRYQLLYTNDSGDFLVPNKYFLNNPESTNSKGFTQSPVYLNAVPYEKLKISATFYNNESPSTTPRIFSWALTWQNAGQWQDLFNSSYRVSTKDKVSIGNSSVNISRIQGEWPMFGFNSENNRATTGFAPSSSNIYWASQKEKVGGGFRNPVIGNGKVYIASKRTIYEYNMEKINTIQPYNLAHSFDFDIVNSPAVTNDYIIVATGQTAASNEPPINHIYALKKENISKNPEWTDKNKIPVCYYSSPVIAGDTIFITSWGGDNRTVLNTYKNDKLLAINLKDGTGIWQAELPAASYSTPAVSLSSNIVVAGCSASDNDSIFAFNLEGTKLWSKNIGTIGYASPVIYKDMVFVLAASKINFQKQKETKIYALNLSDGNIVWNKTISISGSLTYNDNDVDDSTPVIYDDVLYVASPNGTLFAFHISDDTPLWSISLYSRPFISPQSLISSPVYADGHIYVGTPSKDKEQIKAVSIITHTISWTYSTVDQSQVLGSPVVSNGLLFVADESGHFYSIGAYKTPTQYINGSIISMPIKIPESYWWNRFLDNTTYNKTISQITFKLVDENNNVLKDIQNGSSLLLSQSTLPRTIKLRADFTTKNITLDNPRLNWWSVSFIQDKIPPFFDDKTIYPSFGGWLNMVIPQISIKVKDNLTGLLVSSARFTLQYIIDNKSYTNTYSAHCTGQNGSVNHFENITANLSSITDYENITALKSITFSIKDLAGNLGEKYLQIKQDITAPNSTVLKQYIKPQYDDTAKFIWINASVTNTGTNPSAIKGVELYYRYSTTGKFSGDWTYFANATKASSPSWKFNFTNKPTQAGGYFEVCTRAIDVAGNNEELPSQGDATFIYDWKKPEPLSVSGETLWFNELPTFSVIFSDDFKLNTIQYRPNFESIWTTIAAHVNSSIYDTDAAGHSWSLKEGYWNQMLQDEVYYLYFRVNDSVGNTLLVETNDQAIVIRKDTSPPQVAIDVPSQDTGLSWTTNFTVSGLGNDSESGIKEALLYYQYSEDNSNWSSWLPYGSTLDSSPFQWQFDAMEGDGYYKVKITVTDFAGNKVDSDSILIPIFSFPMTLTLVMVALVTVLILLSVIVYLKWRKKEPS